VCNSPVEIFEFFTGIGRLSSICKLELNSASETYGLSFATYLPYFAMTLLLESPFYVSFLKGRTSTSRGLALVACNVATHPIVCFVFPAVAAKYQIAYGTQLLAAEIFASITEAILLWKIWRLPVGVAFTAAIAANLFSWWVGPYLL
jgi:hypothetical protein